MNTNLREQLNLYQSQAAAALWGNVIGSSLLVFVILPATSQARAFAWLAAQIGFNLLRYFLTRPRGSQIGAWVSQQSQIISSRSLLEQKFNEMTRKFADGEVPLPSFWGGYRVRPSSFEFWQGAPNRLHDRFLYSRDDDAWKIERLAP